jgi:hypothetical protein
MKTSNLLMIVLAIVVLSSVISVRLYPSVRDFMQGNFLWNGISDFADSVGAQQTDSLTGLPQPPDKSVLIEIPYIEADSADLAGIKNFVEQGGTLIILDDFGYGNTLTQGLGIGARFDHSLLLDPLFCYKTPNLPKITDFSPQIKAAGIEAVGFDNGTVLDLDDPSHATAWSSDQSFLDSNRNGKRDPKEIGGPFPVAAEYAVGKGTVELVADPSVLINTMLEKNDDAKFVNYLIDRAGLGENVFIDRSNLAKSPLDVAKIALDKVVSLFGNPYLLIILVAAVCAGVTWAVYGRRG